LKPFIPPDFALDILLPEVRPLRKEASVKKFGHSLLIFASVLFMAASAHAQEKGRTGVVIAYPTSIGFLWNVSDRVALRPDVSFTKNKAENATAETNSYSVETGLSALFYVKKWQNIAAYLTPRFSYSRSKTTNSQALAGSSISWSYPSSASF